jgi:hypothetical protein
LNKAQNLFSQFPRTALKLHQGNARVGTMPTWAVLPPKGDSLTTEREIQPKEKERKIKTTKGQ